MKKVVASVALLAGLGACSKHEPSGPAAAAPQAATSAPAVAVSLPGPFAGAMDCISVCRTLWQASGDSGALPPGTSSSLIIAPHSPDGA